MSLEQVAKPFKGLSAFQIKIIALVIMTLDHIAAFGFEIPVVAQYEGILRSIGRLAAPLFLFLLVQSIRHTRSKPKFLLRLYLAGMCTELFVTAMNVCLGEVFNYFTPGNILFTFFYTALYIVLMERAASAVKTRDLRALIGAAVLFAVSLLPTLLIETVRHAIYPVGASTRVQFLVSGLWNSFLPTFYTMDYGIGFVLLGAAMYFAGTKNRQCAVFAAFCLLCIAGAVFAPSEIYMVQSFGLFQTFFDLSQCRMIFALPVMLLYNGERGRSGKWFFYWYYPLHREVIFILAHLLAG